MNKPLDPKLDVVFKLMLTRPGSEPVLLSLVNAVLRPAQPIVSITILNPELDKSEVDDRGVVLDLRLRLMDDSQINVEMQAGWRPGMRKRVLYHWARLYSSQLVQGDQYDELARSVSVFLLGYNELPSRRFHATFQVREVHDGEMLTDQLELHLVQLRRLPRWDSEEAQEERLLVGWGRFFMAKDDKEREDAAMSDPDLAKAKQMLDELSADPVAQRLAADREEARHFYRLEMNEARRIGREEGREQGLEQGLEQGQRKLLLDLTRARFGEVSADLARRIDSATVEQLLRWGAQMIAAESIEAWRAAMESDDSPAQQG